MDRLEKDMLVIDLILQGAPAKYVLFRIVNVKIKGD